MSTTMGMAALLAYVLIAANLAISHIASCLGPFSWSLLAGASSCSSPSPVLYRGPFRFISHAVCCSRKDCENIGAPYPFLCNLFRLT